MDLTTTERAYVAAARDGDQAEAGRLAALIDAEQGARERRLAEVSALLNAALWYIEQGHPVFPCIPGGKRPATAHGFKDATIDHEQVIDWWKANPNYNIGLPTGLAFDVADLDGPAGLIELHDMIDAGQFPPTIAKARTPRGRHYYVPATGRPNAANLLPQVDYRGVGGYVVAPPSRTPEGKYRWFDGHHLPPAPETQ